VSIASFQSLVLLALGFAFGGLVANGYQIVTRKPPSFDDLAHRAKTKALASLPFLIFAAPFIIIRNIVRDEGAERNFGFVTIATVIAGFWSLMCGTAVVMALEAIGVIGA
jgi:hypothetical protein